MKAPLRFSTSIVLALAVFSVQAQVNSGSDGHDGAFHPTNPDPGLCCHSLVIDMVDHPDGIYHYTSVNIPYGVVVSFIPNANNTPVVWLVQSNCVINGTVDVSGQGGPTANVSGPGGPGGYRGANGGPNANGGQGPGGGPAGPLGGHASYGSSGQTNNSTAPGPMYGNGFLLPLVGGSGGGGATTYQTGGGGGGGAILIASSDTIAVDGYIYAFGGPGGYPYGGGGSGGAIRLIAVSITGSGALLAHGASLNPGDSRAGSGRVRIDAFDNRYSGSIAGVWTEGFQPIILPIAGQGAQLTVVSVAGVPLSANPSSVPANPAVIIPAQQANLVPIVVRCSNIPLNTSITVTVKPVNGAAVSATANNTAGTEVSSTATVNVNTPRGSGIIYATTVIGIAGQQAALNTGGGTAASYAQTGLTTSGERFAKMEITAALGGKQEVVYITESGKRYSLAAK